MCETAVEKRYSVAEAYCSPGRRIVLGKCGSLGEFEKCSGSIASPSPCR